jgi:hypothetical protein
MRQALFLLYPAPDSLLKVPAPPADHPEQFQPLHEKVLHWLLPWSMTVRLSAFLSFFSSYDLSLFHPSDIFLMFCLKYIERENANPVYFVITYIDIR